ncbi:MAG: hypothetical protein IAE93_12910 [Ignavibacteria bacterium]|nr:hypothetical protein [Ignavibacteria bacterium]
MATSKLGTTIKIDETDSSFVGDKIILNEAGLLFSKTDTIDIGSTVTADGGEVVNILQANEPRITCQPSGIVQIPSLQAGEILATNDAGDEICGTSTYTSLGGGVVSTTKAKTGSIIILTPHTTTPDGELFVDSISNGVSFTVGYTGTTDPQEFYWFIINPA